MKRWSGALVLFASVIGACSDSTDQTDSTSTLVAAVDETTPPATTVPRNTRPAPAATTVCAPGPGAQCSFAQSFSPPLAPGADLTGIDLRNATLGDDVDFDGVVLSGARLDDADLSDADLTGAILTGATLTGADVNATLFDADDVPTALANVSIGIRSGETLSGVNLRGFDLTGASFVSHANGVAPMAGARFSGATLTGASFERVDLTASDFSDAVFAVEGGAEPTFTETTCPDFLPSDATLAGRAACRL
jgi:uncharacterized protein YjbI with pentapeptide repeats